MNSFNPASVHVANPFPWDAPRSRPPQVVVALWLSIAGLTVTAVAMALGWEHKGFEVSTARVVFTLALTLVVEAWILYKIYVGRNWARILYLILSLPLPLLNDSIRAMSLEASPLSKVSSIVNAGIAIAVLLLLFTRPGNTWFENRHPAPAA